MTIIITRKSDHLSLLRYADDICPSLKSAADGNGDAVSIPSSNIYFFLGKVPDDFITGSKIQEKIEFESYSIPIEIETDSTTGDISIRVDYDSIEPKPESLPRIKDVIDAVCVKKVLSKIDLDDSPVSIVATEPRTAKIFSFIKDDDRYNLYMADDGSIKREKFNYNSSSYEARKLGFSREKTMQNLLSECGVKLIRLSPPSTFTPSYTYGTLVGKREKIMVLTPSLENAFARTGGVGTVVSDLAEEFTRSDSLVENHVISPDYDFLSEIPREFVCKLRHMYKGTTVESDVFETNIKGYKQFLIAPHNSSLIRLFTVGGAHAVYSHDTNSSLIERGSYLASATAAFVGVKKEYDIIHQHSWATALTKRLVCKHLGDSEHLPKFITTIHGMLGEVAMAPIDLVRGAGVELPGSWDAESFNLFYECIDNTDLLVMVSKYLFNSACSADIPLRGEYIAARDSRRMRYISNGISLSRVSPALQDSLGFERTAIVSSKMAAKTSLAELKVITDPEKPLFLYLGRFSPEKGVSSLPDIIQHIIKNEGNVIVIGKGDPELALEIKELQEREGFVGHLFVSLNDDEFQGENLSLIRAAVDFQLVPSISETSGLVAMEAMVNGAVLVTTAAGGLSEIVKPVEIDDSSIKGNSFVYRMLDDSYAVAIDDALSLYSRTSRAEKEKFLDRLIRAGEGYSWEHIATEYGKLYEELLGEQLYKLEQKGTLDVLGVIRPS